MLVVLLRKLERTDNGTVVSVQESQHGHCGERAGFASSSRAACSSPTIRWLFKAGAMRLVNHATDCDSETQGWTTDGLRRL